MIDWPLCARVCVCAVTGVFFDTIHVIKNNEREKFNGLVVSIKSVYISLSQIGS